ncbi:zinc finger and BTB domain-containing protein 7B [Aplochiton taeniatus]
MSPGEDGLIGIPFPEHSSELLSRLNAQRRAGLLCDLTLTSRGARYPTHRSVMAAVSLYFRRLFGAEEGAGDGEGGGGGGFSVCQLDCVAPDALDALLEFAYTATLTIRSSGMRDVLRGAQLLGIKCVVDACLDILGETGEADGLVAEEERAYHTEMGRGVERQLAKGSRRKTDRKRVKRVGSERHPPLSHPTSVNPPPSPPASHPSPLHDGIYSLTSTQPPSPEQEEAALKPGQNGEPRGGWEPGRGPIVNGGVHWPQDGPLLAYPPPSVPASDGRLSEDEEASMPASGAEREGAVPGPGGGRKRKSQTPQQCPVCQKIIHGAGKLPRHMRTHTGEKPFQCSACGVRFTRNDKLKIHMRKHTGERPYPCPHCPARFLHSYDLKNHLSLHSGARPFECPQCHKAFAREDHLQRHRKGHSCLELRVRRPRRGPGHGEEGRGAASGGGGRGLITEPPDPLEPLVLQPHSSAFLGRTADGGEEGSEARLMFKGQAERSLALQALARLGPHSLSGYPGLLLRGLDLRAARGGAEGEEAPAAQHERWEDKDEEEMGEDDEEE